ncbi:PPE family protein [Mycobacterium eburneum]|nr:PPE family protein [Mycobacterium eburneum]TDH56711.1 PPE family protein [Mycobacterium eburneum]
MFDAPPEITSPLIYTGPGAAPLLEAAQAWDALTAELTAAANGWAATVAGIPWSGPSSVAMRATASVYHAWLTTTAAHAQQTAMAARSAAAAYQAARALTVPPTAVLANRTQLAALVATNLLGQNTALIAANEAQYGEMWAQDTAAMIGYHAQAQTATSALPTFTVPAGWNPFAPGSQNDTTGLNGFLNSIFGTNNAFSQMLNSGAVNSLFSSGFWYSLPESSIQDVTSFGFLTAFLQQAATNQDLINRFAPRIVEPPLPTPPVTASVSAVGGGGARIGALSVPPSWAQQAPRWGPASTATAAGPLAAIEAEAPEMLPLPLSNMASLSSAERAKRQPRYGDTPTVMPKNPYGG